MMGGSRNVDVWMAGVKRDDGWKEGRRAGRWTEGRMEGGMTDGWNDV